MADQPGKKNVRLRGIFAVAAATGLALGTALFTTTPKAAPGPNPQQDTTTAQAPSGQKPPPKSPRLPWGGTISPNDPSMRALPPFGIGPDIQPPGIGPRILTPQVLDDIWQNILTRDNTPYKPFMTDGGGQL